MGEATTTKARGKRTFWIATIIVMLIVVGLSGLEFYLRVHRQALDGALVRERARIEGLLRDVGPTPESSPASLRRADLPPAIATAIEALRPSKQKIVAVSLGLSDPGCFDAQDVARTMDELREPLQGVIDSMWNATEQAELEFGEAQIGDGVLLARGLALLGARSIRNGREPEARRSFETSFAILKALGRRRTMFGLFTHAEAWRLVEKVLRGELERFADPTAVATAVSFENDTMEARAAVLHEIRLIDSALPQRLPRRRLLLPGLLGEEYEREQDLRAKTVLYLSLAADFLEASRTTTEVEDLARLAAARSGEEAFTLTEAFLECRLRCLRLVVGAEIIEFRRKAGRFPKSLEELGDDGDRASARRRDIEFHSVAEGVDLTIERGDVWQLR